MIQNRLFVGNLSYDFDEDTLRSELTKMFSEFGDVLSVQIPMNNMVGRIKGIAFVTMGSEDQAMTAMEKLNGADIGSEETNVEPRPLRIDIAKPFENKTPARVMNTRTN
jgi:RNA recognition motif-containing protein